MNLSQVIKSDNKLLYKISDYLANTDFYMMRLICTDVYDILCAMPDELLLKQNLRYVKFLTERNSIMEQTISKLYRQILVNKHYIKQLCTHPHHNCVSYNIHEHSCICEYCENPIFYHRKKMKLE
jgi:hypothetical protein